MNRLQFRYNINDEILTLRPYVDGVDLLEAYENSQGRNPDDLLPPLSSRLLPTRGGHAVILGVCSCREPGCGSLTVAIRRDGDHVVWEPTNRVRTETLTRSYRFPLAAYLDAVDGAAGDPPAGEGTGRRVARRVRLALGLFDQHEESLAVFHPATIDWISAWPWTSSVVRVSVTTAAGQAVHEYDKHLDETESQLAARICRELTEPRKPSDAP